MRVVLETVAALVIGFYWNWTIHNPVCNFIFKCGCRVEWDGGWATCNIHNATGPRCPWCASTAPLSWTTDYLVIVLAAATVRATAEV